MPNYEDLSKMYQELPAAIQDQFKPPEIGEGNAFNARVQDGLPDIELVYHLIPGPDRRLDPPCTVQKIAAEFDISEEAARHSLNKLADKGVLYKDDCKGHSYLISPDYWDTIGASSEPAKLLRDGGIPTTNSHPSAASTTKTKKNTVAETDSAQSHLGDSSLDRHNECPLVDFSDGEPTVPVAASAALLTLGVADSSLTVTAGLIMSVSWLAYEFAKLPNYTPRDTIRALTAKQSRISL